MQLLQDAVIRDRYDVAIVGSGIGGLTTGALLAKQGLSVLVVDQHYLPGGACSVLRRDGVTFDAAVGMMFGFGESGFSPHRFVMNALEEEIDIFPHPNLYRMTINGRHLTFWRDFERFFEELVGFFPQARDELRALYDHLFDIHDNVMPKGGVVVPPTEAPLPSPDDPPSANRENIQRLLGLLTDNTEDILKRFISDPEVLAFFNMLTCTYCYTTAAETPAILSAAMFVDNHEGGIFYPCGSTQMLSNKLEKSIEEHGGRVITRHLVEEILIHDGKARGVRLDDGTVVEADRVVSNATVWNLYRKLIKPEHVSQEKLAWVESLVPTFGSVVLYLWVDEEVIPEDTPPILFLIKDMYDITGNDITIFLSSVGDPSLCPPGTHSFTVVQPSQVEWPRPWDPDFDREAYERLKRLEAEKLLDQVETEFPTVRKHIRRMEVGTPTTIERFLLKEKGAVGGPKQMMGQELMKRLHARSEWENLYHCGDSTVMGVGISATTISGVGAANMVLRDLGRQEYEAREFERQYVNLMDPKPWTPVPDPAVPVPPELAARLAQECQLCEDAPCLEACPTSIDVLAFARKIEGGNLQGAVDTLRDVNPFSEVCGSICPSERLCEKVCNRGRQAGAAPVRIRDLHGWVCRHLEASGGWQRPPVEPSGRRVAVVGAGPGGLTCAHYLARLGYAVEVYDKSDKPGGILSHSIPLFRLPQAVIDRELSALREPGITHHLGRTLGEDLQLADLERDCDAVFLAPGLARGRQLDLPGIDRALVSDALSLLERFRAGEPVDVGERVLVIGGGGVSSDVALSLHRASAKEVRLVCLEAAGEMLALDSEVAEMLEHGVVIENGWGPLALTSPSSLGFARCTRVKDEAGRFSPLLDEAGRMERSFDQLVLAVGQELDPALARHLEAILGSDGLVSVDRETMKVRGREALFAGGDIVRGAGTVVEAVADGRRAAATIDRQLRGA
ncbi:MAG: FAD-dependent oxidoreductase [Deltaproteobacteria bacterium]|nr:FAD-dependent oxidoreductase [Deltaproteobacteria bacterium]